MSPWPRVVIQGVFVEQANSVCYLLCSRFISENCIVPPFAEQVMECGGKQRDCHSLGFWWCCTTLLKCSDILPVILTLNLTCQHTECVRFLNMIERELWLCASACVFVILLSMWESLRCMLKCMHVTLPSSLSVNSDPLTQPVWRTHSSQRHVLGRQTGGGAYGYSLLKSLNIHCHGSFDPCTVELTCMTILWCGEPRRGRLWGSYVAKLWEQHALNETASLKWRREHVGDTWAF